jgi:hypothetical protein
MKRHMLALAAAILVTLASPRLARADTIVTDPVLNETLHYVEQHFAEFVASHVHLTTGSSQPIHIEGKKGKVNVVCDAQGTYTVEYGSIDFEPTEPVSQSTFNVTLVISNILVTADASMHVTRATRAWEIDCPSNQFSVSDVVFTSQVVVNPAGTVTLVDPQVHFDPTTIMVSISCLPAARLPVGIPEKVAKKAFLAIEKAARASDSEVVETMSTTATAGGTFAAALAASPCASEVMGAARVVAADLAAISQQAQSAGFSAAVQDFVEDLRIILPTLAAPDQATVEQLLIDLESVTSASSDGGTTITPIEQLTLTRDLTNVAASTGLTREQMELLIGDMIAVLDALAGVSTDQLEADLLVFATALSTCVT